jgi:hypothetical protein
MVLTPFSLLSLKDEADADDRGEAVQEEGEGRHTTCQVQGEWTAEGEQRQAQSEEQCQNERRAKGGSCYLAQRQRRCPGSELLAG